MDLTTPPDQVKTRRPWMRATGTIIVLIGIGANAFSDVWLPKVYSVLGSSGFLGSLSSLLSYLHLLLIVTGAYLILKSIQKPFFPSKSDLESKS